jgi:hypothetical protein
MSEINLPLGQLKARDEPQAHLLGESASVAERGQDNQSPFWNRCPIEGQREILLATAGRQRSYHPLQVWRGSSHRGLHWEVFIH